VGSVAFVLSPIISADKPSGRQTSGRQTSAYFNYVTSGTNVPPVLAFVPLALAICPSFPDYIYGEKYGKVE